MVPSASIQMSVFLIRLLWPAIDVSDAAGSWMPTLIGRELFRAADRRPWTKGDFWVERQRGIDSPAEEAI